MYVYTYICAYICINVDILEINVPVFILLIGVHGQNVFEILIDKK